MFGFVAPPAPLPSMIILCIQCNPGILKPFQHGSVVGTLFTITVSMFTSIAEGGEGGMWFDWCNTTNSRTLVWNNFLRKMLWMQKQKKCCWKATWMMRMMKKKEHGDVDEWSSLFRTLSQEDVVHAQNVLYKNGLSANGWSNIGCLICDRIVQSIWWATDILCWRAWEIYSCCNVNKTYLLKSTISRFCVNLCDAYRLMLHGNNQYSVYSYNIKVQYCYR